VLGEHRIAQRLAQLQLRAHAKQRAIDDVAFGVAVEFPVLVGVPRVETGFAQPFQQVTPQDGVAASDKHDLVVFGHVGRPRQEAVQGKSVERARAQRDGHAVVAAGRGDVELGVVAFPQALEHPVVVGHPGGRDLGQPGRVVARHGQAELRGAGLDPASVWGEDRGLGHVVTAGQGVVEAFVAAMAARVVDALGEVGVCVEFRIEVVSHVPAPLAQGHSEVTQRNYRHSR
jgi:hypothetical protein